VGTESYCLATCCGILIGCKTSMPLSTDVIQLQLQCMTEITGNVANISVLAVDNVVS